MPELAPFRGLLFDHAKVTLGAAVAPPTVTLDPGALARRVASPHSVAHLFGGPDREAAARVLAAWHTEGVVVRDPTRAIYRVVETSPAPAGVRPTVRRGVIAAVRLESVGDSRQGVAERTVAARVEDRLAALRATALQVEPPLAVYTDAAGEVERLLRQGEARPPIVDVTTDDGVRHQLWRIADAELIGKIRRVMIQKKVLLVDGCHAYAAMVAYRDQLAAEVGGAGLAQYSSAQYGLMQLCASNDEGLQLRAIHRVLHELPGFDRKTFLARAAELFSVEPIAGGGRDVAAIQGALESTHAHLPAIAVAMPGEADAWRLTLDPHVDPRNHGVAGHPSVVRLDVNLLHGLVLDRILGLGAAAQEAGTHLRHVVEPPAALAALADPGVQAAFFLGTPRLDSVRHVVESGEQLPPWSVTAQPALAAGLVMSEIHPDVDLM